MNRVKTLLAAACVSVAFIGGISTLRPAPVLAAAVDPAFPNTLTAAEKDAGWKLLFDGKTLDGWRNYKKQTISNGWKVEDGALVCVDPKTAGDIVTKDMYESFELVIDFKMSPAGNSGIMFHVTEDGGAPWQSGPEIQLMDNKDGKDPNKAGWLYALYTTDKDATKPAGEWNTIRIIISPQKCEHYMNGEKYVEYVIGSEDWKKKVDASKFGKMPNFGKPTTGLIALQGDHGVVLFRNIKIRPIK